jgi:hypothetical protein
MTNVMINSCAGMFDLGGGVNKYFILMTVIIFIVLTQYYPAAAMSKTNGNEPDNTFLNRYWSTICFLAFLIFR